MTTTTMNFGWTKPDVGASTDAWGGILNTDLDGIDSTVKSVSNAIPAASITPPAMDGTQTIGSSALFARADHIHPSDTSRLPTAGGTVTGALAIAPSAAGWSTFTLSNTGSGQGNVIYAQTATSNRWSMSLGDGTAESGVAVGSNFTLISYNNTGAAIATVLGINRATGVATFSAAIVNGPSDRTLKENIVPLEGALDKVCALQGVAFNMIATPEKREIGLIAQDVQPIVPEIVQVYAHSEGDRAAGDKLALDYPKLTALLIEAVKTLTVRIEALEAA